jgi:hypothetical protein
MYVQVQNWKEQFELIKVQLSKPTPNMLKKFEELLLDKTLFKVQNQALGNKNPNWKECYQTI